MVAEGRRGGGRTGRKGQLNAFRLDAAENVFLEASCPAEEFVLGRRHRELMQKLLFNQVGCAN